MAVLQPLNSPTVKDLLSIMGATKNMLQNSEFVLTVDVYIPNMGFYPSTQHTEFIFQKYTLS